MLVPGFRPNPPGSHVPSNGGTPVRLASSTRSASPSALRQFTPTPQATTNALPLAATATATATAHRLRCRAEPLRGPVRRTERRSRHEAGKHQAHSSKSQVKPSDFDSDPNARLLADLLVRQRWRRRRLPLAGEPSPGAGGVPLPPRLPHQPLRPRGLRPGAPSR